MGTYEDYRRIDHRLEGNVVSVTSQIGIPNSKQYFQYILSSFSNFMC